jgi:hypothetical protein
MAQGTFRVLEENKFIFLMMFSHTIRGDMSVETEHNKDFTSILLTSSKQPYGIFILPE